MRQVGEQPVAHVHHRGGPGPAPPSAAAYGGSRPPVRGHEDPRRPEAAAEHREPGRPPSPAARTTRDHVAGPARPTGSPGRAAPQIPSAVTETTTARRPTTSPPTTRPRRRAASSRQPVGQAAAPTRSAGRPARPSPTSSAVGLAPIAAMSARFCAAALCPTSHGLGPVAAEMDALHQHVGRGHHAAVGGSDDGGVVAGTEEHLRRRSGAAARSPSMSANLAGRATRVAVGSRHARDARTCPGTARTLRCIDAFRLASRRQSRWSPAYILIQTEVGKAADVASAIAAIAGVTLAEDVTGAYDVIVRAEARASTTSSASSCVAKVQAVPGITRTLTCPVVHL